jgi:hypothetical protein
MYNLNNGTNTDLIFFGNFPIKVNLNKMGDKIVSKWEFHNILSSTFSPVILMLNKNKLYILPVVN